MTNLIYPHDTIFKTLRDKHNLTQVAMAEKLNISQPAYSMLEAGSSWPSFEVITQTMESFSVPFKKFREYYRLRKSSLERATTRQNSRARK